MKIGYAAVALALITSANFMLAESNGADPSSVPDAVPSPADGAIKGGSIPRESATPEIGAASTASEEAIKRCNELSGSLREQCLLQERGADTGGTRDRPEDRKADPRVAPPPQNPR
jgi:hypothetical protein